MSELLQPGHERADIKLIESGLKRGFRTSDQIREWITKKAASLVSDKSTPVELKIKLLDMLRKCVEHDDAMSLAESPVQSNPIQQHQHLHAVVPQSSITSLDAKREEAARRIARISQD